MKRKGTQASSNPMRHGGRSCVVAHRGGAALFPENSPTAFRHALTLNVDAIECDVHFCSTGEIAVIHDPTLERTLGVEGRVSEMTFAALQQHTLLGTKADHVLRLEELIAILKPARQTLSLEIKGDEGDVVATGMENVVLRVLEAEEMVEDTIVHSFDFAFVERFAKAAPNIRLGANVEDKTVRRLGTMERVLEACVSIGADMLNIDHTLLDVETLHRAWDLDLAVTVWTVNSDAALQTWLERGVDYITTDRPDVALRLRSA